VYSAAAEVLTYKDGFLDGKSPVVTYKEELVYTKWQFPANAKGAGTAAKPDVSSSLSDTGEFDRLRATAVGISCIVAFRVRPDWVTVYLEALHGSSLTEMTGTD
jgi:hypothetical protein